MGLEQDPEAIYTEYRHPDRDPWRTLVLPVLRQLHQQELATAAGLSVRRLRDVLKGKAHPRSRTKKALERIAVAFAREDLR